jgi:hypothetical protein
VASGDINTHVPPRHLTDAEVDAIRREVAYLEPHVEDDEAWVRAVADSPCFCAERFVCTRHKTANETN